LRCGVAYGGVEVFGGILLKLLQNRRMAIQSELALSWARMASRHARVGPGDFEVE
jgi:hypothetical protein